MTGRGLYSSLVAEDLAIDRSFLEAYHPCDQPENIGRLNLCQFRREYKVFPWYIQRLTMNRLDFVDMTLHDNKSHFGRRSSFHDDHTTI